MAERPSKPARDGPASAGRSGAPALRCGTFAGRSKKTARDGSVIAGRYRSPLGNSRAIPFPLARAGTDESAMSQGSERPSFRMAQLSNRVRPDRFQIAGLSRSGSCHTSVIAGRSPVGSLGGRMKEGVRERGRAGARPHGSDRSWRGSPDRNAGRRAGCARTGPRWRTGRKGMSLATERGGSAPTLGSRLGRASPPGTAPRCGGRPWPERVLRFGAARPARPSPTLSPLLDTPVWRSMSSGVVRKNFSRHCPNPWWRCRGATPPVATRRRGPGRSTGDPDGMSSMANGERRRALVAAASRGDPLSGRVRSRRW